MINEIIKVCVRIPSNKKEEILEMAKRLRSEDENTEARAPGWDAKAIHKIAKEKYGSLVNMFEHHKWPERGSDMMGKVQARIKHEYGSVEKFVDSHA